MPWKAMVSDDLAELDATWVEARLAEGRDIKIPCVGLQAPFGIDGRSAGLSVRFGGSEIMLSYWMGGPTEWAELAHYVSRLQRDLDHAIFNTLRYL
jgi:hypothetical protein